MVITEVEASLANIYYEIKKTKNNNGNNNVLNFKSK